jgi:hypothetical protein
MSTGATIREAPKETRPKLVWPREPMLVTCQECEFVWPVLWCPFDAGLISKVNVKVCPSCGNTNSHKIRMASRSAGDLRRYAEWLATELKRAEADAEPPTAEKP